MTEDQYDEAQERDATIGHAKMVSNYIIENMEEYIYLSDYLADFINELENSQSI